jgi:hypothetical protein
MGRRITVKLTPKIGAFERLTAWVGGQAVVNTTGGGGEGSRTVETQTSVVRVEAVGTHNGTYECEVSCGTHAKRTFTYTLDNLGSHEDRSVRC